MLSFDKFKLRFPEFEDLPTERFELFLEDARLEMGLDESRWLGFYDVAQAYLVAHMLFISEKSEDGDGGVVLPVRRKEVDDVVVEHAVGRSVEGNFDQYASTTYGQKYTHYRRIAFAGPRVV